MGAVYLAEDLQLFGKQWAVKELVDAFTNPQERAAARQQFEHEARILVALDHPNLLKIVRYFPEGGRLYLVMEYIEGRTLEEILNQTPGFLPETQVVDWAKQICDVLDYLHSRVPLIVFRDLKPSNVMLGRDNRIRLIDFGIARLFDPHKQTDTLKMGTHGYAPPEQYTGMGRTDARSDVYGLGATMYHLLTKQVPVDSVQRILPHPMKLLPPRQLNPSLSTEVEQVILTAMNEHPDHRYQSAALMKAALSGQAVTVTAPATARCAHCGAVNRSTARFCSSCGQTMPLIPSPAAVPQSTRKGSPFRLLGIGLGVTALLAMAFLVMAVMLREGTSTTTPTATAIAVSVTSSPSFTVPAIVLSDTPAIGPGSTPSTPTPGTTDTLPPVEDTPTTPTHTALPPAPPTISSSGLVHVVGKLWEQDGVSLVVTRMDVRAESDRQDAAAQVWFALTNHGSERVLVEIDLGHIHLVDSFGQRFSDWEGGGFGAQWLDPGKTWKFNRYYSEMAGQESRVTRSAEFVLVKVDKLGPIESARWQFDIIR